ncbi:MAG TPA: hypothetical protein VNT20_19040 [Flavisolibacter sp.]|jgi:hypothetical protein|nr:hypothetical protein [Flavisolibacter sp.]
MAIFYISLPKVILLKHGLQVKMNKAILFFTAVYFLVGCGTQKNSASLKDEPRDSVKKIVVKNILIAGSGSVAYRIFLENLSEDISSVLKAAGVKSDFIFLGKIPLSSLSSTWMDSVNYDAYIAFTPVGKETLELNKAQEFPLPLWKAYVYGVSSNSYKQTFAIRTYVKTEKINLVWETSFKAGFDPTDKEKYKFITTDILGTLYTYFFASR